MTLNEYISRLQDKVNDDTSMGDLEVLRLAEDQGYCYETEYAGEAMWVEPNKYNKHCYIALKTDKSKRVYVV
jgi:hypothetical protein